MDEKQFERLASDELERIDEALSALDGVDVDLADGILTWSSTRVQGRREQPLGRAADLGGGKPRRRSLLPGPKTGRWFDSRTGEDLWDRLQAIPHGTALVTPSSCRADADAPPSRTAVRGIPPPEKKLFFLWGGMSDPCGRVGDGRSFRIGEPFSRALKDLANTVAAGGQRVVVSRHGYPMVALVSQEDLAFLRKHARVWKPLGGRPPESLSSSSIRRACPSRKSSASTV